MAAMKKLDRPAHTVFGRSFGSPSVSSSKILHFAQKAYDKTGGATDELRRVHGAYLANQKKAQHKD